MPVLSAALTATDRGFPPRVLNHAPVLRSVIRVGRFVLVRGNTRFLYSVLTPELPVSASGGVPLLGLSGSLTFCETVHHLMMIGKLSEKLFCFSFKAQKFVSRLNWLTEWQSGKSAGSSHFAAWFLQSVVVININQPALSVLNLLRFYLT